MNAISQCLAIISVLKCDIIVSLLFEYMQFLSLHWLEMWVYDLNVMCGPILQYLYTARFDNFDILQLETNGRGHSVALLAYNAEQ